MKAPSHRASALRRGALFVPPPPRSEARGSVASCRGSGRCVIGCSSARPQAGLPPSAPRAAPIVRPPVRGGSLPGA
eukprot:995472-Prymnesium_polylepis.1